MAFHLKMSDLEKARQVAERAVKHVPRRFVFRQAFVEVFGSEHHMAMHVRLKVLLGLSVSFFRYSFLLSYGV